MQESKLSGKVCVVTGATSGIGLAVALSLAGRGGRVLGIGRDPGRAEAARALVAEAAKAAGGPEPRYELADLSLMAEVSGLARRIAEREARIDVLVNCAGIYVDRRILTAEGLETQFAVNHLAPFLLTKSLLPLLEAAPEGRVITVSSDSHYYGWIRWRDPSLGRCYLGLWAYEQSKLANVLFSYELARRLGPSSRVRVAVADPGLANTSMGEKHGSSLASLFWSLRRKFGTPATVPAEAIASLAALPEGQLTSGLYWKAGKPVASSRLSYREKDAKRLWELSEALVAGALAGNALPGDACTAGASAGGS